MPTQFKGIGATTKDFRGFQELRSLDRYTESGKGKGFTYVLFQPGSLKRNETPESHSVGSLTPTLSGLPQEMWSQDLSSTISLRAFVDVSLLPFRPCPAGRALLLDCSC
jgi:hypothetical protein